MISAFLLLTYLNHNTMYIQTSVLYANNEDSLSYLTIYFGFFLAFDYCLFCVVIRFFHLRHNG